MKSLRLFAALLVFLLLNIGCGGESKDQTIKRLINSLSSRHSDTSPDTREHNMKLLAAQGSYAVPYLINALENKDAFIRKYCAMALAKIGSEEAVEPIQTMLFGDSNDENRGTAADCLVTLKKEAAIPVLINALKANTSANARQGIRTALIRKDIISTSREQLLPYLKDSDSDIRIEAREIIVNMGQDSVPALTSLLSSDDQTLIKEVFRALKSIGDKSALPIMKDTMKRFPVWDNKEETKKNKFYKDLEGFYNDLLQK